MKKVLLVVALVGLMVPATFARDYVHSDGSIDGNYGGKQIGTDDAGNPIYAPAAANPDWEYQDNYSERKAESYNWPAEYKFVDICKIPVFMDVGFWVRVIDCQKLKLVLKQVEIHCYEGTMNFTIQNNTQINVQASFSKKSGMPNIEKDSIKLNGNGDTITVDAGEHSISLYLKVKNVDLAGFKNEQVGKCVEIGSVTLKVRPTVAPVLAGGC